jgi:hypothetical protein
MSESEESIELEGIQEVDWATLWGAFIHPDVPSWENLDPASRGAFKINWYGAIMPTLHNLVLAVEVYDRSLKASRN